MACAIESVWNNRVLRPPPVTSLPTQLMQQGTKLSIYDFTDIFVQMSYTADILTLLTLFLKNPSHKFNILMLTIKL